METFVIPQSDYDKIDALQIRIFRTILNIKHSYWPYVTNDTVMKTANNRAHHLDKNIDITPLSLKFNKESLILMDISLEATPTQIR